MKKLFLALVTLSCFSTYAQQADTLVECKFQSLVDSDASEYLYELKDEVTEYISLQECLKKGMIQAKKTEPELRKVYVRHYNINDKGIPEKTEITIREN